MKAKILFVASAVLSLGALRIYGVPTYLSFVPNGNVASCSTCHTVAPSLNSFGADFALTHAWSPTLAAKDSDGDGFSNGQELGDPKGVWTPGGSLPIPGAQVTMPGSSTSKPTLVPPNISITSPANGATVPAPFVGPVSAATTNAAAAITSVKLYSGTTLLGTSTNSPFNIPVNLAAGSYALKAVITDYLGATNTSAAVNLTVANPLSITLNSPTNGTILFAPAKLTLGATPAGGTISKVEFFAGATLLGTATTAPYSVTASNLAAGSYAITAKVTDSTSATATSAPVSVTVDNPPTVALTSPANNSSYTAPATIALTATATDTDGTIAQVQFFAGTNSLGGSLAAGANLIGTVTTSPYTLNWTNVMPGTYAITAQAKDNLGAVSTSAVATVTVIIPAVRITGLTQANGQTTLTWTGGLNSFTVQMKTNLTQAVWTTVTNTTNRSVTLPMQGSQGFLRVSAP